MTREKILIIAVAYILLMSVITFICYGVDKAKAKNGSYRIPEKVLLLMSFLGGAIGGFLGMQVFRHKTKGEHWYFTFINIVSIILHIGLVICIAVVFTF